jgi:hypothetical protein
MNDHQITIDNTTELILTNEEYLEPLQFSEPVTEYNEPLFNF